MRRQSALYRARWSNELDLRSIKCAMGMSELRCKAPEQARKEVWAHVLAYNLIRTVMAQAAATHDAVPRSISFTGALQALVAFRPLLELRGRHRRTHAPGPRSARRHRHPPGRRSPRLKKRRWNHYDWLTRPRAEIRQQMAKGVTQK